MNDTPDWDKIGRDLYASKLFSSHDWFMCARQLAESASLLAPHVRAEWAAWRAHMREKAKRPVGVSVQAPYMMLSGMSLECLCKAGIVVQHGYLDRRAVAERPFLPKALSGHKTSPLLKALDFPLNLKEENLVQRLERAVVWSGRYPVPRRWTRFEGEPHSDGRRYNVTVMAASDTTTVPVLLNRFAAYLGHRAVMPSETNAGA
jgi:hypothetical protein